MVSPGPRFSGKSIDTYRKNSQPADIIEGVSTAINVMKEVIFYVYTLYFFSLYCTIKEICVEI